METIQQIRDQKTDAQVQTQGNVLEHLYQGFRRRLKRKGAEVNEEGSQEE